MTNPIMAIKDYFKPVPGDIRKRDVFREFMLQGGLRPGIVETSKQIPRDLTRLGLSVYDMPQSLVNQQTSGYHDVPVLGRLNSFQDEAKNRVNRGDPMWKAMANPAIDAILSGADAGALLGMAGKAMRPISSFARDVTNPIGMPFESGLMQGLQNPGLTIKNSRPQINMSPGDYEKISQYLTGRVPESEMMKYHDAFVAALQKGADFNVPNKSINNTFLNKINAVALERGANPELRSLAYGNANLLKRDAMRPINQEFKWSPPVNHRIHNPGLLQSVTRRGPEAANEAVVRDFVEPKAMSRNKKIVHVSRDDAFKEVRDRLINFTGSRDQAENLLDDAISRADEAYRTGALKSVEEIDDFIAQIIDKYIID